MTLILMASPKGGVGKTTLCAGVADALVRSGRHVIALDLDPQNGLRLHFGVPITDQAGFMRALPAAGDWRSKIRPTASGVQLLPHGATDLRQALALHASIDRAPEMLAGPVRDMLSEHGAIVLADLPPGASAVLAALVPVASILVAVLLADPASTALLPDIESGQFHGSGTLSTLTGPRVVVALNQVDPNSRLSRSTAEAVARYLGPRLIGAVCRDDAVAESLAHQRPLLAHAPDSMPAHDLRGLAAAIGALLPNLAPPTAAAPPPPLWGRG